MVAQSHSMARHQLVGLVLMSMVYGGQGCVFHCKTETCGAGMELTTAELYVGGVTWLFDKRWAQHGLREGYAIVGVVNLSSSGITGLAPGESAPTPMRTGPVFALPRWRAVYGLHDRCMGRSLSMNESTVV